MYNYELRSIAVLFLGSEQRLVARREVNLSIARATKLPVATNTYGHRVDILKSVVSDFPHGPALACLSSLCLLSRVKHTVFSKTKLTRRRRDLRWPQMQTIPAGKGTAALSRSSVPITARTFLPVALPESGKSTLEDTVRMYSGSILAITGLHRTVCVVTLCTHGLGACTKMEKSSV